MKVKYFLILLMAIILGSPTFAEMQVEDFAYYQQQVALQRYPWNMSGFIRACMKGDNELVENYIRGGMNVNQPYMDATPLIMAIHSGNNDTVKLLLENGADPNLERATLSPLHFAIRRQQAEIVETLIKYNVNVNQECKNIKPLNFAIKKKNLEIVESLINAGAKPNSTTNKLIEKSKNEKLKEIVDL